MTINEVQINIDKWIKQYGVRYFNELTNMALLTEEVGELSRLIAREYGEQSFKKSSDNQNIKEKLADEMADVFFVLSCLANQMDIDLTEAIQKNLEKKNQTGPFPSPGKQKTISRNLNTIGQSLYSYKIRII